MRNLFIIGFPGLYGGAATELHHQIKVWLETPELKLHIIPTMTNAEKEPLYQEMVDHGILIHGCRNYEILTEDDAVINFCSKIFLQDLPEIYKYTKRIMWVNCMTYLFPEEKEQADKGYISHYLYQREGVRKDHDWRMGILNRVSGESRVFIPYFDASSLEYSVKDQEKTHIGRISRQDTWKYTSNTLHIYEYIVSPKSKQGHFLGFNPDIQAKTGKPFDWIKTYANQNEFPVKEFYEQIDFIVQPTDTTENLPRIGFEAMFSGKPLVVDNRGGWQHLIEHGVSGFLCNHERDFIYYGSRLAYDLDLRNEIATNARQRAHELSNFDSSKSSWEAVFESVYNK